MIRRRLRPEHSPRELARIYGRCFDSTAHTDHQVRLDVTAAVGSWITDDRIGTIADLSCGDRGLTNRLHRTYPLDTTRYHLGDITDQPGLEYVGPIEQTIDDIPPVDLFLLSETLEHLNDPDMVLSRIRANTRWLLLSTPDGEVNDRDRHPGGNWEHYWGWDHEEVGEMLKAAGFTPVVCNLLRLPDRYYDFQIWLCR